MINDFEFFDNLDDAVCVFDVANSIVFKNKVFSSLFSDFSSLEKFKKHFNFDLCLLSSENISQKTPLDIMFNSSEKFHTYSSYRTSSGEYILFYIYSFIKGNFRICFFKDVSSENEYSDLRKKYRELEHKFKTVKDKFDKAEKLKENASSRVLKMGIINRISLVIRETNDLSKIISRACEEINTLAGAFKTYFCLKSGSKFKIVFSPSEKLTDNSLYVEYDKDTLKSIKEKQISVTDCRKEYVNADKVYASSFKRVIIPVHDKNKLLGIMVTLTRQKFSAEDNAEILRAVSYQLSGALITSGLITQLNKKNKKLEKALNELKETQIQLINTEKMASLGRLVSGVAHEINTPLASINSNAGLIAKLLNGFNGYDEEKIKLLKDLNSIDEEAVKRISDIVKSLRKFVRLDEAEFQPADINAELDLTLKLLVHETKNDITVVKNYGVIPPVMCSVNMLNQVFMNILLNACHGIQSSNHKGIITVSTEVLNNNLTVKIKDNGIGIPQSIQNKIFNVGFTTKKIGLGTGLGLSISKKITEIHKGTISFVSKEGEGTEFTVSIPVSN